jgi:probable F420-dependent oxidoreductase
MRFGIATPVVVRLAGTKGWEADAGIAELAEIARTADRLGYHHLTCSEHVGVPQSVAETRGVTYWDPLATFGYMAAVTEQIRLVTNVLVLAYHHPLEIAKRYGTLDVVCGGRLILGFGVGSLKEEFDLLGAPFDDRGPRGDDALKALRASLGRREPSYRGPFYDYGGFVIDPCAIQQDMPFWIGGRTLRSLRRAVALANGWTPFALAGEQVAAMLARVDVPPDFDVVLSAEHRMDPLKDPDGTRRAIEAVAGRGGTILAVSVVSDSLAHYLEQIEAFVDVAASVTAVDPSRSER